MNNNQPEAFVVPPKNCSHGIEDLKSEPDQEFELHCCQQKMNQLGKQSAWCPTKMYYMDEQKTSPDHCWGKQSICGATKIK